MASARNGCESKVRDWTCKMNTKYSNHTRETLFEEADRVVFSIDPVDIMVKRNVAGVDWFQKLHLWCVRCGEKRGVGQGVRHPVRHGVGRLV